MQHSTTSNKGSNQQVSSTVKRFSGQQFLSEEKQLNDLKVRNKFVGDLFCDCCVFPSIRVWVTEKRSALRFYCISSEFFYFFAHLDYRIIGGKLVTTVHIFSCFMCLWCHVFVPNCFFLKDSSSDLLSWCPSHNWKEEGRQSWRWVISDLLSDRRIHKIFPSGCKYGTCQGK